MDGNTSHPTVRIDGGPVTPHSIEVEQAVLGSCLMLPEAARRCRQSGLETEHFYRQAHRIVYENILSLEAAGQSVDLVTVAATMENRGLTTAVGGVAYLAHLLDTVPPGAGLESWCQRLQTLAWRREVAREAGALRALALKTDSDQCLEEATRRLSQSRAPSRLPESLVPLSRALGTLFDGQRTSDPGEAGREDGAAEGALALETEVGGGAESWQGAPAPVPLPWPGLTRLLGGGLRGGGRPVVIASRAKHGKTSAAIRVALHAAAQGIQTVYFSLELPRLELVLRMLAIHSRLPFQALKQWGTLSDAQHGQAVEGLLSLDKLPLHVDASAMVGKRPYLRPIQSSRSAAQMRAGVQRLQEQGVPVGLIVVDYLQLMEVPGQRLSLFERVSAASNALRELATVELGIPVLEVVQIRRQENTNRRATADELKGSGEIEQDCSAVVILDRPSLRVSDEARERMSREELEEGAIIVDINGSGPTGRIPARYEGPCMRWDEVGEEGPGGSHGWCRVAAEQRLASFGEEPELEGLLY